LNDGRSSDKNKIRDEAQSAFSKDQRTVFVTQLVMRTTEKDIQRYFKKKVGCKVNEVILLRDRRTRSHKGCAYVQFGQIEDVAKAVGVSGQAPDFQRFPILVKASEAEKNYSIPASASVITASMMGTESTFAPFIDKDGRQVESQKVYIGGLDPSVSEEHLFAIFSQFGQLEKVSMQMDPASNASRGYAFLSFRDPKDANLAIQSMTGQVLAGRPMKTGWANQASSIPGVPIVTSDEFPLDSSARAQKALQVLGQLVGGPSEASINAQALSTTAEKAIEAAMGVRKIAAESAAVPTAPQNALSVPTVAQARESLQASLDAQSSASAVASALTPASNMMSLIGGADNPTRHILVHNMYNKDEETDPEWAKDIKEEFTEEASKFGKIQKVAVMHQEPGGKIYVSFEKADGARICAENLAGRWFDKRQLRVEFITDDDLPAFMKNS
jgi:RNA-binding protein 39